MMILRKCNLQPNEDDHRTTMYSIICGYQYHGGGGGGGGGAAAAVAAAAAAAAADDDDDDDGSYKHC